MVFYILFKIRRRGVVGRAHALQPGGVRILISVLGLGLLFFLCALLTGGGPDILLTTDSRRPDLVILSNVTVRSLSLPLCVSGPGHLDCNSLEV